MSQLNVVRSLANAFVNSKLTPVIVIFSILLGIMALLILPREEEPQIIVPMADVFVEMPGATPKEIIERVIKPMEKLMQEVSGVEYIYSTAMPGKAMMVVRYYVGYDMEDSLVKLYNKLYSNFDKIPPGVSKPIIKPRTIDDVPIITFTLWSNKYDGYTLRQMAAQLNENIKQTSDVAETAITGGYRKTLRIDLIPTALAAYNIDPAQIVAVLQQNNVAEYIGQLTKADKVITLKVDGFLSTQESIEKIVIKTYNGRSVFLKDLSRIELGPEEIKSYTFYREKGADQSPAVTISVAKRKGANATKVAETLINKLKEVRGDFIPDDVNITITRNYGETASARSNELLVHMFIAIFSVTALIWIVLGRRESWIVAIAIPTTLALTLATFVLYGFTLNRVTFFALIFSIGILVDDAIVVVENIVRHFRMPENKGRSPIEITVEATNEVGNPTILATMAVIAAILPMAFVGGLMGPYMRPIPIGASSAMIFSMLIAFTVIPWATVLILGKHSHSNHTETESEDWMTKNYKWMMTKLIREVKTRYIFLAGILLLLIAVISLVYFQIVRIKMLPFDNKSEFQIMVDTKEGTTLESTLAVAQDIGNYLSTVVDINNYQIYAGEAAPFNFNGLVRHYYLRGGDNIADIQVNLQPKFELFNLFSYFSHHEKIRWAQSHEIAKGIRPAVNKIADRHNARVKIVEVPPGPPVLQTLVLEVYGPDYNKQKEIAQDIMRQFAQNPSIVDIDWHMEDPHDELNVFIDHEKASRSGLTAQRIVDNLKIAFKGAQAGLLHDDTSREDVPVWVQIPEYLRSNAADIIPIWILNDVGEAVPVSSFVKLIQNEGSSPTSIYHKNLLPVVYVTADVSGKQESPVYAIMELYDKINNIKLPDNYKLKQYLTAQPPINNKYSVKWDGEWQITYEVFKDLSVAFIVVLILIYALIVGWFQSFKTPFIIMAVIPISLIGILPAHAILGAFFTATSMIGFIAGAGIVVRNSIILVDFIELRLNQGMTLSEAVIDAGAVRFKPMMLTAMAVVVGASVILFDPIFQGLAISLMAGEVASLLLSRTTVPIFYYMANIKTYLSRQIIHEDIKDVYSVVDNSLTSGC